MKRREFVTCALTGLLLPPSVAFARRKRKRVKHPPWAEVQKANAATLTGIMTPPKGKKMLQWDWLIVHHTAAEYASLKGISSYHAKRFEDPLGIQYHFLIGNGKKAPRGLIQIARWQHQERAIHLFKPELAPRAVTVCLTGNLEKRKIYKEEFAALVALGKVLTKGLKIPRDKISTHRGIDGRLTQCPGKHFPLTRFKDAVAPIGR